MNIKHLFINLICAFVVNKRRRDTLRTKLKFNTKPYIKFVHDYIGHKHIKIKCYVGHGCQNFIIVVNNQTCFKFPMNKTQYDNIKKQKIITDYFRHILPVQIPHIKIIKHDNMYITKYDFIDGITIDAANKKLVKQNISKIAFQISNFLFDMSVSAPDKLQALLPRDYGPPSFLYGWSHMDIGGNFILHPKTMDIVGFIDWDNANYGNIIPDLVNASHHWSKLGYDRLGIEVLTQYTKKYLDYKNLK